jgi:S1-C subfamily serine protease
MTLLDWGIVAFGLLLMPFGYRMGLVVGGLALVGFIGGIVVGARVVPLVLAEGSESPYAPLVALLGGLMIGAIGAVVFEGVGLSMRERLVWGRASSAVDGIGGCAVAAVLVLAVSWVLGAVALNAPALRDLRDDVQRSAILSALNDRFPPSGPILNVLNRIDRTPQLRGPSAEVDRPDRGIVNDPEVQQAAASTVRILGTACGLNVSGTGWVAGPDLVVTNAHVVAGSDNTTVQTADGASHDAQAFAYRPRDDIAVLRAPGLGLQALPLEDSPQAGSPGAVAGFPGGGPLTIAPARLGSTGQVQSQDSYGRGPVDRRMTSFRGRVESGNSGGPVIGGDGQVLTTIFAATVTAQRPEGLGVPNDIVRRVVGRADSPVDTGPCA